MNITADELAASPRWFPHLLDPVHDRVLLVDKPEDDYREASFLDDRSLRQDRHRQVVPWPDVVAAAARAARHDVQYIFHVGHVGSTLLSRLLGELPQVLALREPAILRTFCELLAERDAPESIWAREAFPGHLQALTALLSRSFRADQRAMVKATSFVSEIAPQLVPPGSKALLLYSRPQRYLETILAGENSRQDMRMTGGERLRRLHRRLGEPRWRRWEMAEGELVAMAWATEMTSLLRAADTLPPADTLWVEFDDFLAAPAAQLRRIGAFFGLELDAAGAESLAQHPHMTRYSKAPEYQYGPGLRQQLLEQARRDHREALAAGRRWLDAAAREVPVIGRCLSPEAGSTPL